MAEDRSEFLEITDDGRMALNFSTEFDETGRAEVGDRLQVTPQSADFGTQLGSITIPGQDIPDITIPLSSLIPGLITGIVIPEVPGVAFADPDPLPLDIEGVTRLVIEEGGLDVTLENGLPLPLASIILSLRDRSVQYRGVQPRSGQHPLRRDPLGFIRPRRQDHVGQPECGRIGRHGYGLKT